MGGDSANGGEAAPALQVIVLGSGGGPIESNTTAFLIRALSSGWRKGSIIALDAGVQLSAITRILHKTQPLGLGKSDKLSLPYTLTEGPFTGLEVPFASPEANAAHIQRNLIDTYLITHPHLDHVSGFVINTAGLPGSRPKRLAGLPSTISAFKTHIFNNVIWPNLSDENNGAGLVTYMRLVEGGSPALGDGEGKGYMEITDGLAVKVWGVSHGHCIEKHSHRGSGSSTRYGSMDGSSMPLSLASNMPLTSPRSLLQQSNTNPTLGVVHQQQQQRDQALLASTPQGVLAGSSAPSGQPANSVSASAAAAPAETVCVYDSSAYFIRDVVTGREILMFGDVEPDSISLSPRNLQIWQKAAPRIVNRKLAAIFIECSYDDSQSVDRLFGHLAPRFVMQELASLAEEVKAERRLQINEQDARETSAQMTDHEKGSAVPVLEKRKRKREGSDTRLLARRRAPRTAIPAAAIGPLSTVDDAPVSPRTVRPPRESSTLAHSTSLEDEDSDKINTPHVATREADIQDVEVSAPETPTNVPSNLAPDVSAPFPLKGLKVVLMHVKEKMDDGPPVGEIILSELLEYEKEAQLGCEFIISRSGESLFF